jgi:hypothetical protein
MTPDSIREALDRRPFVPFKVRLPDGEELHVPTSEHAHLIPSGRRLLIFTDDDRTKGLDPNLISCIESATQ